MKKIAKNLKIKALLTLSVLVMFLFTICELKAQDTINSDEEEERVEIEVFNYHSINPEFPGGSDSLNAFIKQNLQYPKSAKEQGIEGIVNVKFFVDSDGSIKDAKIEHGVNEELDAEAIRIVNLMPKWEPGRHGSRTISVLYELPIVFRLK